MESEDIMTTDKDSLRFIYLKSSYHINIDKDTAVKSFG